MIEKRDFELCPPKIFACGARRHNLGAKGVLFFGGPRPSEGAGGGLVSERSKTLAPAGGHIMSVTREVSPDFG